MRDRLPPAAEKLLELLKDAPGGFRREGTAVATNCPRCGRDKLRFRLVDPRGVDYPLRFTCYSPSCRHERWDGHPEFALAEILGLSVGQVRAELYGRGHTLRVAGDFRVFDLDTPQEGPGEAAAALPTLAWPGGYYPLRHPAAARGVAYLEGRGIPLVVAERYGIRYAPELRSVVFPIESGGRLVGWQSRLVIPTKWRDAEGRERESNKTSTSPGFLRQVWMFGDRLAASEEACVFEGPVDAVKGDLCGGNCASLGKELTPGLVRALAAYPWRRLYVGLDRDAVEEVVKLVREFDQAIRWPGRECYLIEWPDRVDPATGKPVDAGALSFEEVLDCKMRAKRTGADSVVFDLASR